MQEAQTTIPLTEVAQQLQTTPLNVLMHVKRGMLAADEIEGVWMIHQKSLHAFMAEHDGQKATDICSSGCSKAHGCGSSCG